jgi:hypothetical protein
LKREFYSVRLIVGTKGDKRPKGKHAKSRRKFSTPLQARIQLEGITAAQQRYRREKKRRARNLTELKEQEQEGESIIADSIEKSEQGWKNALRSVYRLEDLDGFD